MFPSLPVLASLANISTPFKRSSLGLFHGKLKQYGNNVPFSKKKTRRTWLPNVQNKRLLSEALGRKVEVKVTTRALRTIHKHGSLDQYLLKTNPELLGYEGMRLRILVREARQARADTEAEAKRLEEEAAELEKRKQLDEQAAARLLKQKELEIQRKIQAKKERKKSQAVATGILGTESSSASSSELARNS